MNTGVGNVLRPGILEGETRPLPQVGSTSLVELSHPTVRGGGFSWGVGGSTVTSKPVVVRASGALDAGVQVRLPVGIARGGSRSGTILEMVGRSAEGTADGQESH